MSNKQQSSLDEELRAICKSLYCDDGAANEAVAQIKQAFADENYVKVYDTKLAQGVSEGYVIIPEQPMTGQEFYDRFEKEAPGSTEPHVFEAARRAAGITETKR